RIWWRLVRRGMFWLSLVTFLGFVGLWLRSYGKYDIFDIELTNGHILRFNPHRGEVLLYPYTREESDFWQEHQYLWVTVDARPDDFQFDDVRPSFQRVTVKGPGLDAFVLPHWFFVLIAALSAIAWRPSPRFRFSIRELLVLTTLSAVVLGFFVAFSR